MIKVIRNTGMMGAGGSIKIHINGEKVKSIKQNKRILVEITTQPWNYIALVILIIMMSILSTIFPMPYKIIAPVVLSILYLATNYFVPGYELKLL